MCAQWGELIHSSAHKKKNENENLVFIALGELLPYPYS